MLASRSHGPGWAFSKRCLIEATAACGFIAHLLDRSPEPGAIEVFETEQQYHPPGEGKDFLTLPSWYSRSPH
jgi:hypothetical protein